MSCNFSIYVLFLFFTAFHIHCICKDKKSWSCNSFDPTDPATLYMCRTSSNSHQPLSQIRARLTIVFFIPHTTKIPFFEIPTRLITPNPSPPHPRSAPKLPPPRHRHPTHPTGPRSRRRGRRPNVHRSLARGTESVFKARVGAGGCNGH